MQPKYIVTIEEKDGTIADAETCANESEAQSSKEFYEETFKEEIEAEGWVIRMYAISLVEPSTRMQ